ncbi:MAG: YcdB/YcdC domain-containing protein, partial [Lysinibacillus sp.]
KDPKHEESYYIELDKDGCLLSLSQPLAKIDKQISVVEQQYIAEQFLRAQYAEALHYYTLSDVNEDEEKTCFKFEQFAGDILLADYYCFIEVSLSGQILDFNFRGFTKNPPILPENLVPKETVLTKLFEANWTASLSYLASDMNSVPVSGLYVVYESPVTYSTFDAVSGANSFEHEEQIAEEIENEVFVSMPIVAPVEHKDTIEDIIGVTPSMEMNSYMQDRIEETVKATIKTSTQQLKSFVWFKDRNGDLDLTYEKCKNIAVSFMTTYYRNYLPYLQMRLEAPSFNEHHRAFFTFPIVVDGNRMDGEIFIVSVNKTTGFIDMLMTPRVDIASIQAYTSAPLLSIAEAKKSLQEVDAILEWSKNYDSEDPPQILQYKLVHNVTQQRIKGINAVTGELIRKTY